MSEKNPIRLFVTHEFADNAEYHRVFEYLEASPNFFYRNCSVPDHPPAAGDIEALKREFRAQIKNAELVIVLSSVYLENEYWTTYQMAVAQANDLPMIGVEVFGTDNAVPVEITKRCAEVISWNERAMVDAIRRHARHEDTQRWETVEFKL
jgi:hypothetical protein